MTKQVIVMRKDLNMRKGKMIAQGGHAVVANVLEFENKITKNLISPELRDTYLEWLSDSFKKITLSVTSEEELISIYDKCLELGFVVNLIEDSGLTEFHGVKTKTCLAIGPHKSKDIDVITSNLKLL